MTHTIVILAGPTISRQETAAILDAVYLPPARQGDIYAAFLKYRPDVIGLIDGHFENTPAPWHKEILFVMSQGVKVYGASSMGALRAAELYPFGMIGAGEIFAAYKDRHLEDDDEVAIIHGPETLGYPALSDAMVNIRKTLENALEQGVIQAELHDAAIMIAKNLFYQDRTYPHILESLSASGIQTDALALWLQDNRRDLKKEDALCLLQMIRDEKFETTPLSYQFQNTHFWNAMKEQIEKEMI